MKLEDFIYKDSFDNLVDNICNKKDKDILETSIRLEF